MLLIISSLLLFICCCNNSYDVVKLNQCLTSYVNFGSIEKDSSFYINLNVSGEEFEKQVMKLNNDKIINIKESIGFNCNHWERDSFFIRFSPSIYNDSLKMISFTPELDDFKSRTFSDIDHEDDVTIHYANKDTKFLNFLSSIKEEFKNQISIDTNKKVKEFEHGSYWESDNVLILLLKQRFSFSIHVLDKSFFQKNKNKLSLPVRRAFKSLNLN